MVALQSPRSTVIAAAALVARFSQCANEMFGNALPLLLDFSVNLSRIGFARRRLPNTPHDNYSHEEAII